MGAQFCLSIRDFHFLIPLLRRCKSERRSLLFRSSTSSRTAKCGPVTSTSWEFGPTPSPTCHPPQPWSGRKLRSRTPRPLAPEKKSLRLTAHLDRNRTRFVARFALNRPVGPILKRQHERFSWKILGVKILHALYNHESRNGLWAETKFKRSL